MADNHYPEWHVHWSGWAYNQPDWKPSCDRCHHRRDDCRKFNAKPGEELAGRFAGRWLCPSCALPTDVPTPSQVASDEFRIRHALARMSVAPGSADLAAKKDPTS